MKGEIKTIQEDLRFYWKEKRQPKKKFEALKVSAAYMHTTAILSHTVSHFPPQPKVSGEKRNSCYPQPTVLP
jgi:hypothetical protein